MTAPVELTKSAVERDDSSHAPECVNIDPDGWNKPPETLERENIYRN